MIDQALTFLLFTDLTIIGNEASSEDAEDLGTVDYDCPRI